MSRNSSFQQQSVSIMYWLISKSFPASVGINAFVTIMLLALTTNGDGGALLTTQRSHICLILSLILCGY